MCDIDAFFVLFFSRLLQLDTKQIEEIELVSGVLLFCFVLFASKCDLSAVALDRDSIFILSIANSYTHAETALMDQNGHLARRNSKTVT